MWHLISPHSKTAGLHLKVIKIIENDHKLRIFWTVNPLTPRGDQHETSPYNILTLSCK